jgi:hypothetical protein
MHAPHAPVAAVADLRPALADISGACRYLGGIGRSKFYSNVMPDLDVVHIGARTFVTVDSLDRLISERRSLGRIVTGLGKKHDRDSSIGATAGRDSVGRRSGPSTTPHILSPARRAQP